MLTSSIGPETKNLQSFPERSTMISLSTNKISAGYRLLKQKYRKDIISYHQPWRLWFWSSYAAWLRTSAGRPWACRRSTSPWGGRHQRPLRWSYSPQEWGHPSRAATPSKDRNGLYLAGMSPTRSPADKRACLSHPRPATRDPPSAGEGTWVGG